MHCIIILFGMDLYTGFARFSCVYNTVYWQGGLQLAHIQQNVNDGDRVSCFTDK